MLAAQSQLSGHELIRAPPKSSSRRPLQPKNINQSETKAATTTTSNLKPKPHHPPHHISNKENVPHIYTTTTTTLVKKQSPPPIQPPFDASLADELSAIREKLERQRIDRDKNERLLKERGLMLDLHLKEILHRGELQKQLEIEVDRLYRLKEIKLACMRISGIRSLRDKEQEKKMNHHHLNKPHIKTDQQKDETPLHTPKK
ncbi:hypothetical protein ABFS82_10G002900 [Erythranthe guttata]|uniref:Uncharacterized protein n=1 Tax=Erythranthe guttata TaxID=4155 RepID=A0A022RQK0_ERYGU|nr:PREDICTED: high mobility group B protein 6 [Erythranthe guttata]EYU42033.1 hypothetical protein MIMGU_mgv1a014076mg [Erythranthe guttata]|eukprot:XP_012832294.1 PREDICTED: high mobility group B protein 6 [Erythranthe guttata]